MKIIVVVKAIMLFHFDINGVRIVHVDMGGQSERRLSYSIASMSGLAGHAAEVVLGSFLMQLSTKGKVLVL